LSSNENTQKPPKVKKPRRWLSRLMWISGLSLLFLACLGIGVGLGAWFWISYDLPKIERLADYRPPVVTTILAADGSLMAEFSRERRYLVPVDQLPKHVVGAFVSAEDGGFFDHQGLDYMGILRAAYANLRAGRVVQGGSTITQQVARALLLSPDRTYLRKIKEMILAWRIENYLSKDDILYLYLNQIYLGHGAYGVEAASRTYFGKHASQLNLAEAALLAGLVQAPSRYSPLRHPRRARNRQVYVIGRMLEDGRITSAQAEEAINQQLQVSLHRAPSVDAPYYSETVRQWLEERYGKNVLYEGGLTVHTACDPRLTELAYQSTETGLAALTRRQGFRGPVDKVSPEKAKSLASAPVSEPHLQSGQVLKAVVTRVDEKNQRVSLRMGPEKGVLTLEDLKWARKPTEDLDHWPAPVKTVSQVLAPGDVVNVRLGKYQKTQRYWELELVQEPVSQAALLAMETGSGKVRVLLGGRDFAKSQYNRATQAHRQPGSAFKPFIYAAALDDREKTYTPVSIFMDAPVVYDDPSTPMQKWKPKNYENRFYGPTTLREALEHSRNVVTIKLLAQLGMDYTIDYTRRYGIESPLNRTLSLALGTSGISLLELTRAYAVFANQGKLVEPMLVERVDDSRGQTIYSAEPQVKQVISAQTAYLMTYLLSGVMTNGTGRSLQIGRPSAGKTGTSNDLRDAWFLGYTPQLVCGVWVGQDDNKPLGRKETGARAAGPIWREFMKEALANQEPLDFPVAEGVVFHRIDRQTGRSLPPGDNGGFFEAFLAGTEPPPPSPIPTQPADPEDFLQSETFAPNGAR
jgi:penicillin-binding protein 1A